MPVEGNRKAHSFGGDWTATKLQVIEHYLKGYVTALKKTKFCKGYIDAFAGTGYRDSRKADDSDRALLFPDLAAEDPQKMLDGSARLALKVRPSFDRYIFIERNAERCRELESLKEEFPDLADTIMINHGDANEEIVKLCKKDWSCHRAVLFLDPYGMQVEWSTIEAVAGTKAIDLWLLFPLGVGVNRLLKKDGDIPEPWRARLNSLLGTEKWYDDFYTAASAPLFDGQFTHVEKASIKVIGHYFNNRLKELFPGVAERPGVLKNSVNNPLYLLCFAVSNASGKNIALKIANHLLDEVR